MIHFKKIRWKNLLSTGDAFTEIDFTRSKTTLIVGENGAGKSTVLDALSFVLYGKPFRKVNKPQLINTINEKKLLVEIEFKVGRIEYLIRRGIKPAVFEIFQNDTLLNQDAASIDYQDYLEKHIIKLNHKSFSQIVVLGSASFVPFMQLTATNRREIIEDLLDLQIFSTMNSLLKDKITFAKNDILDADYHLKNNAEKIELYKKHIDSLRVNNEELIKHKEEKIVTIEEDISNANQQISLLGHSIEQANSSISDQPKVSKKIQKLSDLSKQVELKLSKLQKEIEFFKEHDDCPVCRQGIQHEHKQEIVERDSQALADVLDGKSKLQVEIFNLESRIKEIETTNSNIQKFNQQITEYNFQITTWNKFVGDIKSEIEALKANTTQIDKNNDEIILLKERLKQEIQRKENLVKERQVQDIAASLLKDNGIKSRIIKQYIPIINKLVNKYLAALDFFVNFELNESFEESIKSRFRDVFSYESFSEGEKMRIDLALLFTWRAVAKLRNSVSTNLLIMDEVFDSSLDSSGTEEFLKILDTLTGDINVFIISHKTDTLYDKFRSVIRFEKHKNFSRIAQ